MYNYIANTRKKAIQKQNEKYSEDQFASVVAMPPPESKLTPSYSINIEDNENRAFKIPNQKPLLKLTMPK